MKELSIYHDTQDPANTGWAYRIVEFNDLDERVGEESGEINTLDDLLDALRAADRISDDTDMSSLPTFGGDEPEDTSEVFSWDAGRLLVGGQTPFEIIAR